MAATASRRRLRLMVAVCLRSPHFRFRFRAATTAPVYRTAFHRQRAMGGADGFSETTRNWLRRLRGRQAKEVEVRMLQPVALAGASRRSEASSRLCSSFAATAPYESPHSTRSLDIYDYNPQHPHSLRRKALSDGSDVRVEWRRCQMCERNFVVGVTPYKHHCSLDCKSASFFEQPVLLAANELQQ